MATDLQYSQIGQAYQVTQRHQLALTFSIQADASNKRAYVQEGVLHASADSPVRAKWINPRDVIRTALSTNSFVGEPFNSGASFCGSCSFPNMKTCRCTYRALACGLLELQLWSSREGKHSA